MTAEFVWVESASTALTEAPRYSRTQFGDGYAQDAPDGLNPIVQSWKLSFKDCENSVADQIIAFFRARVTSTAGLEAFSWVPVWATAPILVKCETWSRTVTDTWGECDVTATFTQWIGP